MNDRDGTTAQDAFVWDPDSIRQIATWLIEAGLDEIEIVSPTGARVRIAVAPSSTPPSSTLPVADATPSIVRVAAEMRAVTAPYFGRLRLAPSPGEPAFAPIGTAVRAGDPVALIEIDTLCIPVVAPCGGIVVDVTADADDLVGYGARLLTLERRERRERPD